MEHLNLTTKLLGLEDPNIDIQDVVSHQSHMEIKAKLDYQPGSCPHCQGKMIKYDFQRESTIPQNCQISQVVFYYNLYQLLLFHFQERRVDEFFGLIEDHFNAVNPAFEKVFRTFRKYKEHVTDALELPYSNAKLEATNKLIKDIKRQAFGFRNFKIKILIALNIRREKTHLKLSRC